MIDEKSILMRPGSQSNALRQLVGKLPDRHDMIGAEIGSYIGESAEIFAQSGKFKKFYCIDPWKAGYDPSDIASNRGCFDEVEATFDARAAKYPIIEKVKMTSSQAAARFSRSYLDFVYIDGNHTYCAVKADLRAFIPKVKPGGFVGGHDYGWVGFGGSIECAVLEELGLPEIFDDGNWLIQKPPPPAIINFWRDVFNRLLGI